MAKVRKATSVRGCEIDGLIGVKEQQSVAARIEGPRSDGKEVHAGSIGTGKGDGETAGYIVAREGDVENADVSESHFSRGESQKAGAAAASFGQGKGCRRGGGENEAGKAGAAADIEHLGASGKALMIIARRSW